VCVHHLVVTVDRAHCIRCASCSILAPGVFAVSRRGSSAVRQPEGSAEERACVAAALVCPTQAITADASPR